MISLIDASSKGYNRLKWLSAAIKKRKRLSAIKLTHVSFASAHLWVDLDVDGQAVVALAKVMTIMKEKTLKNQKVQQVVAV
jgi:hypothetical protein